LGKGYLTLKNKAEAKVIENEKVQARIAMTADPSKFMRDIKNPEYLPALKGGDRLDMIDKVKPISDAYKTDAVVKSAVSSVKQANPDMPYDIEARYDEVKRLTNDPIIRNAAFNELQREKRIHDQGVKERFDYNNGAISSALQQDKNLTINDVKKMPAFQNLPVPQQSIALGKAQTLMSQRSREERAVAASERSADAAANTVKNQKLREQKAVYDKVYNAIMGNEVAYKNLGTMSEDEFNALLLSVGDENQARLLKERLKLQKDTKYVSVARQRIDIVNNVIRAANITDESDKALYQSAVSEYVGDETDIAIIRKKAAEAMQNAVLEKPWYWTNRVTITGGKKFVGTKDGKNVYQLPDGKWQVGE